MKIFKDILNDKNKYNHIITEFKESDFGRYVLTWLGPQEKYMIGKLVQIRLEAGCFGSDCVFLRHFDNLLMMHENQSFYEIDKKYIKELDILFSSVNEDTVDAEYTIKNENGKRGFIIKSEIGENETPMRNIKNALYNKIGELIQREDARRKGEGTGSTSSNTESLTF